MDRKTLTQLKMQTRFIKSLAHPTRLFILKELLRNKRCVSELTDIIGSTLPTISRHLSILRNAGLIEDEKHGTYVSYALKAKPESVAL